MFSRFLRSSKVNLRQYRSFSQLGVIGEELLAQNDLNKKYDTVIVGFNDIYGRLLGKRYDIDYFLSSGIKESKSCTYTFALDMPMTPLEGFKFANWSSGFGDFILKPDITSFRIASWLDRTLIILCDVHDTKTGELVPIAPRSMLKNAIKKMQEPFKNQITVKAATELEYYLYNTSYEDAARMNYNVDSFSCFQPSGRPSCGSVMTPAGFYSEDYHILQGTRNEDFTSRARKALKEAGIQVETSKGETGIGQHELNISYDEVLTMADNHVIYKQCLKEIAMKMNKSITFMAKPVFHDAGSSCHVHLSIHDQVSGANLFYKDSCSSDELTSASSASEGTQGQVTSAFEANGELKQSSDIFRHFLAGWMTNLSDFFVFYCPTVNSYKRLKKGSWAPTSISYGIDNRTVGFRIITDPKKLRIECRIPGADVNPYLTFTASLLSGLHGIKNRLEPCEMLRGDGYSEPQSNANAVPVTLSDAAKVFKSSSVVEDLISKEAQEHYSHFYDLENEAFENSVTDWERKRYFEQI